MKCRLIFHNILHNRKKAVRAIISICFSVMLIFSSINAYISFQDMRLQNAYQTNGEYNITLHNVTYKVRDWILEQYKDQATLGVEKIVANVNNELCIVDSDAASITMNHYQLEKGIFPQKENEIAISATAKYKNVYIAKQFDLGDTVTFKDQTYTISGILNDYDYSTQDVYKVAIVNGSIRGNLYNIYIHFNDRRDYQPGYKAIKRYMDLSSKQIFNGDTAHGFMEGYHMITNGDLNAIEIDRSGGLEDTNIGQLLMGFIILIILTSLILGIHIFLSYMSERSNQQGILMSLGFSNSYIFSAYFLEGFILIIIGCVLGLILGRYITILIFKLIQSLRTIPLEHFAPQFQPISYMVIWGICVLDFIVGICPVLIYRSRMKMIDIMKGGKNNYKVKDKRGSEKGNIMMRYSIRDTGDYEKVFSFLSLVLIGMVTMLVLMVNRYVSYQLLSEESQDVQFSLISDDVSHMDDFENLIPGVSYYDEVYDTMGEFFIDPSLINMDYADDLIFSDDEKGVWCEIVGVSEKQYNRKIEMSQEVSYNKFVQSGGVIIIDNYKNTEDCILNDIPDTLKYAGRQEEEGPVFSEGEVPVFGRSRFLNWKDQNGIAIIVPEELFKKQFDYTNVLININVKSGYELKAAEFLNTHAPVYEYSFFDTLTDYIRDQDNKKTIQGGTYGIFVIIMVINFLAVLYIHALTFVRRRHNFAILKAIGRTDSSIILPMLLTKIGQGIVVSIVAVFIVTLLCRLYLSEITKNIVLVDGWKSIALVLAFVLFIQIVAIFMDVIQLKRQRILKDLREE